MSRIEKKVVIEKGLPIKREPIKQELEATEKPVVADTLSEVIHEFNIFPYGWRVLDKKNTNNVNYYLLISCDYDKETGDLSKNPVLHDNKNVFKIIKESVSKFDRFSGGMQKIPDFKKTHEQLVLKCRDRKSTYYEKQVTDYIHSLEDYAEGDYQDSKMFGISFQKLIALDKNNPEIKLRLLLGKLSNVN